MISDGYEKAIFDSPVSERYSLAERKPQEAGDGAIRVVTQEFDLLRDLRRAARTVKLVVESSETLFNAVARRTGVLRIQPTRLGLALMALRNVRQDEMKMYFPVHGFNPYVAMLFSARRQVPIATDYHEDWKRVGGDEAVRVAAQLNDFVSCMRSNAGEPAFKALLERFRRSRDKNTRSVRRYIDAIFRHRGSRHLVIRLDLGYAMEGAWAAARPTSITLEQAKEDLTKFQRYLRDHLPVTGFVAKLEYGLMRGFHFHTLILLNGHLVHKDIVIGQRLGQQWLAICEGRGRYWNCNAQEYVDRGIGMINYDDGEKRVVLLEKVVGYMTKTDFWLRFQPAGKTLFKGLMPQPRPKRGRPREDEC
jgi:hypothetical protein